MFYKSKEHAFQMEVPFLSTERVIRAQAFASFVSLIDQIHHDFYHHIFFLCLTLGNHQGKGYKGVVGQTFGPVKTVKDAVVIEEPKE